MDPAEKKTKFDIWYAVIAIVSIIAWNYLSIQKETDQISYSQFQQRLAEKKIQKVYVDTVTIYGDYTQPVAGKQHFATPRLDHDMADSLAKYGVEYSGVVHNTFLEGLLSWVAPAFLFFLVWYFMFRNIAKGGVGGLMSIGSGKAKVYVHKDTGVTFDDVAGVDEAKEELKEIVDFLRNPDEYGRLGARVPKGVLLVGPPGTGKTLLAKAVAGEAKVPFFSIGGSEFIELFVGVGAARVRDLFDQARQQAPAIIFIDELDALGRARSVVTGVGGHDEREQTLNQLLAEMDGFDSSEGVIILAATNRPEILDPALLRAGRFDRQVLVDKPDKIGRLQILHVHTKKVTLEPNLDLEKVAAITTGFSGADLANLVNEATLQATRRRANTVSLDDFTFAVERIVAGLEKKSRLLSPFERKVVAFHEMGHALVALAATGVDTVHKVSIIPRGIGALGYTIQRPTEDRYLMTKSELESKIMVLLGGCAAEKLVFDHTSTGAADDLARATDIAYLMASSYGMDEQLGHVAYEVSHATFLQDQIPNLREKRYSEATAQKIDDTVRIVIANCFDRSIAILKDNRTVLDTCAGELLKSERLDEQQLKALTQDLRKDRGTLPMFTPIHRSIPRRTASNARR